MSTTIQTKYGTAHLNEEGYYIIKTSKEGNHNKKLHRLIFEDFYQIKLPSHIVIHHDDGNPQNNEIWNLIPMTKGEHTALHSRGNTWSIGKIVSEETRLKMSKAHQGKNIPISARANRSKVTTTTGFLRVYTKKSKTTSQGFVWCYQYQDKNKKHNWSSVNLKKLKEQVIKKGLEWLIVNEDKARRLCEDYGYVFDEVC